MDKLARMAIFVKVVECGSFAAAAAASGISATMVGKYVRAAEEQLGARLLHRTTRRQRLSDVGALYYERCRLALAEVALADNTGKELQAHPQGLLRMVAPVSFGSIRLTPCIADFLRRYPEVKVDLTLDNGRPDLLGENYELGIQIGQAFDDRLIARPLRTYRRIMAASPDYLDAHGKPAHPDELPRHACLGLSYWRGADRWRLQGPDGAECVIGFESRFSANQGEALRQAAIHGAGILLQPDILLEADMAAGRLIQVLPEWAYVPTPIYLVYAQDRKPSAKLRAMIDFLLERFAE